MYRRLSLYPFLLLFVISACNDHLKIEANNLPQGYADSQLVGSWKITAVVSNTPYDWDGNGTAETDLYSTLTACDKDNLYTFVGNKTGTYKFNCNTTKNGTWQIFNVQQLEYTPEGQNTEVEKIISMTSVQFKTQYDYFIPPAQIFTLTKTWSRQ